MPLSWNEIKSRTAAFSSNWADSGNENCQDKPFLIDFFEVFGITDKRVASQRKLICVRCMTATP